MSPSEAATAPATAAAPRIGALSVEGVFLSYRDAAGAEQVVLDMDRFVVSPGTAVGITGPSGSGKTSFLYVASGIEQPSRGRVAWGDTVVSAMQPAARDRWRRGAVGFVFQDFHLFEGMSALQNVLVALGFGGHAADAAAAYRQRAAELLARVGIGHPHRKVERLSRGERQRVAVARALLFSPGIVLADEPTASLDKTSGREVAGLLLDLSRDLRSTVIVVSHDEALLGSLDSVYRLENGRLSLADAARARP